MFVQRLVACTQLDGSRNSSKQESKTGSSSSRPAAYEPPPKLAPSYLLVANLVGIKGKSEAAARGQSCAADGWGARGGWRVVHGLMRAPMLASRVNIQWPFTAHFINAQYERRSCDRSRCPGSWKSRHPEFETPNNQIIINNSPLATCSMQ
ncbi:hypothetical protein FIBSPDRAFT_847904 [Athelia psychrophila]|uniref:Uncharacterized protein n=1 Tax=Athelia psychrophila TaxID=1759441 RepID=A0A166W141_9AGAM|nr:hypothetical protein FIBSPDRAFT_847904 [Fibularhizoctonia sp. CBS 109695]